MVLWLTIFAYFVIGLIVSLVTLLVFRPEPDYRPPCWLVLGAALLFAVLWPVVMQLGLMFLITGYRRRAVIRRRRELQLAPPSQTDSPPIGKPR